MSSGIRGLFRRCIGSGIALATIGCVPLPIPHTEIVAPTLVGHVEERDGRPVAGLRLVVSRTEACDRPTASGATDSSGHFRLVTSPERRRWLMFSLMEFGVRRYWVCTAPGDSLRHVLEGQIPLQAREPLVDSLECRSHAPGGDPARLVCAQYRLRW